MSKNIVIIGGGGHSKVLADIIIKSGDEVIGFLDDNLEKGTKILNFPVLGKLKDIKEYENNYFIIAIGNNIIRKQVAEDYANLKYYTAIHPNATIGLGATIGEGTCVMANSCINSFSTIGKHSIINTGAIVEHDNIIEKFVHISPNATLCGTVKIAELTHIGAGATIKNNISICDNVVIGIGGVVLKDITVKGVYAGIPVKQILK